MMKYLILDIETSGLNENSDCILEVGAIAIDENFHSLGVFHQVVAPVEGAGQVFSEFITDMHTKSGLLEVMHEGCSPGQMDERLHEWLTTLGAETQTVVLAGHTIAFDHRFLKAQTIKTASLLSHRTLDFSAVARLMRDVGYEVPNHEMPHRALQDAIIELDEFRAMTDTLRRDRWLANQVRRVAEHIVREVNRSLDFGTDE